LAKVLVDSNIDSLHFADLTLMAWMLYTRFASTFFSDPVAWA